jgi:hypothetical protein
MKCTLFVGDLPTQCSEYDLEKLFNMVGLVRHVRIQRAQGSQASLGYGFVKMSSHQVATKALAALDGYLLFGRKLRVRFAGYRMGSSQEEKQQPTNCLYVKFVGLTPGATTNEEKIREIYAGYKFAEIEVDDIIIRKSAVERNGLQKGYGFIQFAENEAGTMSAVAVINNLSHVHVDCVSYTIEVSKELQQHLISSGMIKHVTNPVASLAGVLGYDSKYVINSGAAAATGGGKAGSGKKGATTRSPAAAGVSPKNPKYVGRAPVALDREAMAAPRTPETPFMASPSGVEFDQELQTQMQTQLKTHAQVQAQTEAPLVPSWSELQGVGLGEGHGLGLGALPPPPAPAVPGGMKNLDLFSLLSHDAAAREAGLQQISQQLSPTFASLQTLGQSLVDTGFQTFRASISPTFASLQNSIGGMGVQGQRSFPRPSRQPTQPGVGQGAPGLKTNPNPNPNATAFHPAAAAPLGLGMAQQAEAEQLAYLRELEVRRGGYAGFDTQPQYGGSQQQYAGFAGAGGCFGGEEAFGHYPPGFDGLSGGSTPGYQGHRSQQHQQYQSAPRVAADMNYSEQGRPYKPSKYFLL